MLLKISQETVEIKENSTVSDFITYLKNIHPEIEKNLDSIMVAVNEEYTSQDHILKEGDVVALIPPVSGG